MNEEKYKLIDDKLSWKNGVPCDDLYKILANKKFGRYRKLGRYDKVLEIMEKMYENGEMEVAYFATDAYYTDLSDYPGYIELLKKMKLWPLD